MSLGYIELSAIDIPSLNLLPIAVYWPNSSREVEVVCKHLEKILQLVTTNDKTGTLGGDSNVDFLSNNKQKITLSNLMSSFNFKQNVK